MLRNKGSMADGTDRECKYNMSLEELTWGGVVIIIF